MEPHLERGVHPEHVSKQHEQEVGADVPLVHLVHQNVGDAPQGRVPLQVAQQDARRAEEDASPPAEQLLAQPHLEPDRLAQLRWKKEKSRDIFPMLL